MIVNSVNGMNTQPATGGAGAGTQTDPASKNLQQQIDRLQQQLKEISANQEMPAETKMKKRQDLQKQISELQIQLRQRQIDAKREEREKKKEANSFNDLLGTKEQSSTNAAQSTGLSANTMTAMISADKSVKQANVQGSVATRLEAKATTLASEIKLDGARGGDTSDKQAELADLEAKAEAAEASQLSTLTEASDTLQDAAKDEKSDNKTVDGKEEKDGSETKDSMEEVQKDGAVDAVDSEAAEAEVDTSYHPIDVRL